MQNEGQASGRQQNLSEEESPVTQRFSVTIVWSHENTGLGADELSRVIEQSALTVDEEATVEVAEIAEPTY